MMHVDVIEYAIRSTDTPREAAELIRRYESIRGMVLSRNRRADEILKDADKRARAVLSEKICRHEVCRRSNDPSGGSDSGIQCLICDEWVNDPETRFT